MFNDSVESLTDFTRPFLQPQNSTHRQYEALRAYFVEGLSSAEAARRGGYTAGSFRVLVHQFRQDPDRQFFLPPAKGPKTAPKSERLREKVIALRKQNLSIYDISQTVTREVEPLSPVAVSLILKEEGFARLPRRQDEERPPATRPDAAAVANVGALLTHAGAGPSGSHPLPGRLPWQPDGSGSARHAKPVGAKVVRHGASQPRHELRLR